MGWIPVINNSMFLVRQLWTDVATGIMRSNSGLEIGWSFLSTKEKYSQVVVALVEAYTIVIN